MTDAKITKATKGKAKAIHVDIDGEHHVVGLGNLRVAIYHDDKYWVAQGLELDYVAQGVSLDDVKKQFEDGLAATIRQHLTMFGNIVPMLVQAPREVWAEALTPGTIHNRFFQISEHEVIKALPFEGIAYLQLSAA
jgi:hypothetical protein